MLCLNCPPIQTHTRRIAKHTLMSLNQFSADNLKIMQIFLPSTDDMKS